MAEPTRSLVAHVRALGIALVLLLQLLDATPLPELRESHLRNPIAWDELNRWSRVLTQAGIAMTPEEMLQFGLALGDGSRAFRKVALRPWHPFRRLTGTGQSWGLFAYPDPYAGRLTVDALGADGQWREAYRAPGAGHPALVAQLEYRRVRGVYDDAADRPKPRKVYDRLAAWVAQRTFEELPETTEVKVYFERTHVVRPDRRRGEEESEVRSVRRFGPDGPLPGSEPSPPSAGDEP